MRKKIIYLIVFLMILGAAFAGYKAWDKYTQYAREEQVSQELQQYIDLTATEAATQSPTQSTAPENPTEPTPETTLPTQPEEDPVYYPAVDFESLTAINPDVIGWIYIEGTSINYPIVQGEDNRHYVSTMADGQPNSCGSIFMDYRNQQDFSDRHTVIYGHNMRNGSMFADIVKYKKPEYLAAHPTGKIMTPNGNFEFQVIGGYVAHLSDAAWQLEFANDKDFGAWLEASLEKSTVDAAVIPESGAKIITLSTCSYEFSNARFVLICIVK